MAIDRERFFALLDERFPGVTARHPGLSEELHAALAGIPSWEMKNLGRATQKAIDAHDRETVRRHFDLISEVFRDGTPAVVEAIPNDYLEPMRFDGWEPGLAEARNGLPTKLWQFAIERWDERERREQLAALPIPELLRQLEEAVTQAMSAAACDAVARLRSERIYGLFLMHYIFWSCRAAVLTEAQTERANFESAKRWPDMAGDVDRWSPADCGYYFFREDLFDQVAELFMALNEKEKDEVERIFIRAMQHVRKSIITDPRVVLSVMDYTEGPGFSFYANAELFNDATTLAQLKGELGVKPGPYWDQLELERSRLRQTS